MIERPLWLERVQRGWTQRPVVWLSGVRRVGKTTITRMLPDAVYMNCDLPSSVRALEDPELFLGTQAADAVLVFDEVHRLDDPSRLLKIAADEYPQLKILATGSSTLAATRKFSDSLAGRKRSIHLCPVLWEECAEPFQVPDLDRRLLHGGLPELLLAGRKNPEFLNEWIDSFYARDILELFGIRNRQGFLALFRLLLRQSGGQLDYTQLANLSEMSRVTVKSHLEAMQIAHVVHLLRPFHGGGKREIVSRPKCYGFDTGFVTFEKGWDEIRAEDRGLLWEHLVLDSLRFHYADDHIYYWQDKSHREIDFVIRRGRNRVDVVECKINPDRIDPRPIEAFRALYPAGDNYVVSPTVKTPTLLRRGELIIKAIDTRHLPV
ncbi:ATP-binding protein [Thioalkalivibrio sp. XN8]|uniref:ATP-binding protein n=1 Tax=Thioalkalivibrio sp. XN8 TaxID=2712863 RepID=UPI0013EB2C8D|nr:ATP-binding protein [Thioalkalivibrio sp. XN8]NGP53568.1 ATP-binding protein [Thioalkalivibrio sp. XN8]